MMRRAPFPFVVLILAAGVVPAAPGEPRLFDPRRPPDRELELSVKDGFTLAAVGDCIISRPHAPRLERDPGFAAVARVLRGADATLGNLETTVVEMRGFHGWPEGGDDWLLVAPPDVPRDLKALGFDLLARANNHAFDWGIHGMLETSRRLDEAGLVHAGTGAHRAEARAPRYFESPLGRVALVSMASTYRESSRALPPHGEAPGRPGVNALRLTRRVVVPPPLMETLARVGRSVRRAEEHCGAPAPDGEAGVGSAEPSAPADPPPSDLTLFDIPFRLGERLALTYEIDPTDLAEVVRSIRLGKQHADLLVATVHAHETDFDCERPGDFLPTLARAAIDAGADAFVAHGVHHLMPIEIYKGRPVFYGLANFFWGDIQEPLGSDLHERNRDLLARAFPQAMPTDADLTALLNARGFDDGRVFETVIAVSRFDGGTLAEIRIHPVDLGYGMRLTESGVPRAASPAVGRRILERLRRLSEPYGTVLAIEKGIGVIRPGG